MRSPITRRRITEYILRAQHGNSVSEAEIHRLTELAIFNRMALRSYLRPQLYARIHGPILRVRVKGHHRSLKMFAGDPSSTVAYYISREGELFIQRKRRWVPLERPQLTPFGTLTDKEVSVLLPLAQRAHHERQCVHVTQR